MPRVGVLCRQDAGRTGVAVETVGLKKESNNMKSGKIISLLMSVVAMVVFLAVLAMGPQSAQSGDFASGTFNLFTNSANNITNTSTAGTALEIEPGVAYSLSPSFVAAGAGTSNVVFRFNASIDGTNFTTTYPFSFTNSATATTAAIGFHQLTAAQLAGVKKLRFDWFETQQTNAVTLSAIYWSRPR
jgi:hypothetical protein